MKGIVKQIQEVNIIKYDKFTKEDLIKLQKDLNYTLEKENKIKQKWLKERKINEKELNKKAKELNKEIPFEVAWHCFLAPYQTYVSSEFLKTYKEWL